MMGGEKKKVVLLCSLGRIVSRAAAHRWDIPPSLPNSFSLSTHLSPSLPLTLLIMMALPSIVRSSLPKSGASASFAARSLVSRVTQSDTSLSYSSSKSSLLVPIN